MSIHYIKRPGTSGSTHSAVNAVKLVKNPDGIDVMKFVL